MVTPLTISFKVEIIDVLNNGFIGTSKDFKKKARIQDKSLTNNNLSNGDNIEVKIEVIDESDVGTDNSNEFYVAINEFATNGGFYTKAIKEYENRFKRAFWFEERGMIIFPNEDWERFEVNDIIKVSIKRLR
ncbi:MAG: hypothetical protein QQN62_06880 [Nitrosopumilus sp.]